MNCPRCGFENLNNVNFCSNCGLSRQLPQQPLNMQKEKNLDYNMPMNFHAFYAITNLILSILLFLGFGIVAITTSNLYVFVIGMLCIIFQFITAILLLCRNKAGNIMRLISNILAIVKTGYSLFVGWASAIILGLVSLSINGATEEYAIELFLFLLIGGIITAFVSALRIAYNVIVMVYYHKREHMFK